MNRLIVAVLLLCFGFNLQTSAETESENPLGELKTFAQEQPLGDNAIVSLLTVSPGSDVYAHYGHTAIRVCDPGLKIDLVFNYGLFDFHSPNFLWRFVTGKTDYEVGVYSYMDFMLEYQLANRAVTEQVLNLNPVEKETIWQALVENVQPENCTYRYNFFYNNCSTKPRDILVDHISGKVDYRWKGQFKSLRDEIHFYTAEHPWTRFGIDIVIGAPADDSASLKSQQFAPGMLMESFSKAVILRNSAKACPLVLITNYPVKIDQSLIEKPLYLPEPELVMWMLFLIVVSLSLLEYKKGKKYKALDIALFTLAGLLGTLIAFMVLFSEHPTTNVNYLLLWLHPMHLIYPVCLMIPALRNKSANIYLSINLPFQLFALAGTLFLPQYFHPAMYPILFSLMLRSGLSLFSIQKKRTHA